MCVTPSTSPTAPQSPPARRRSSPPVRGWSGRKSHTGQGVRRINSVSATGTGNPLKWVGPSALLVRCPVNVSHRAAIPASTPKVFSTVAGLVRPQGPHRPGRPPNQFGVCAWDGKSVETGWAFGAARASSLSTSPPAPPSPPRRRPRQHTGGRLPGCGTGQRTNRVFGSYHEGHYNTTHDTVVSRPRH